jgi:predicted CopG family antitoxin
MTSRPIMIRKVVYEALEKEKRPGESFSRVLERLLARGEGIASLQGAWRGRRSRRTRTRGERL